MICLGAGCFSPAYENGGVECGPSGLCPDGLTCGPDLRCYSSKPTSCRPGFTLQDQGCVDNDECALGSDSCDSAATCTNTIGSFTCACPTGQSGDGTFCRACEEDTDCGAHGLCVADGASSRCGCVTGYVKDENGACVWGEVPADPAFREPATWTGYDGAAVLHGAPGLTDPGEGHLSGGALCTWGVLGQTVPMPPLAVAEPLVAHLVAKYGFDGYEGSGDALGVSFNGAWQHVEMGSGWLTRRFCLGERAYGGPLDLRLGASAAPYGCPTPGVSVNFDHIDFRPAAPNECPAPGSALNGDMEGDFGWEFTPAAPDNGTNGYAAGMGSDASRAAQLAACNTSTRLDGRVSIPTAQTLPSPALEIWSQGTAGFDFHVSVGEYQYAPSAASVTATRTRFCLPPALSGLVPQVRITRDYGSCVDSPNFLIDDVKLVSDPACGTDPLIADPGFESAGTPVRLPSQTYAYKASVSLVSDAATAETGSGFLKLSSTTDCAYAYAYMRLPTPPASAVGGPALKFSYRTAGFGSDTARRLYFNEPKLPFVELTPSTSWKAATPVCLDRRMAGRTAYFYFYFKAPTSTTTTACYADPIAEHSLLIDNVGVVNDPNCP